METIIVKPKDAAQAQEVPEALRKMNVEVKLRAGFVESIFDEPSDEEILASIERGMQEVEDYKAGKIQLKDAKSLLDEL
jgi:hypothetical protein